MSDCKCDMRTKLVGDGCDVCNPALAVELYKQTIEDLTAERDALAVQCQALRSLLPATRPEYGAPGSRDVDVRKQQEAFDAVFALPDLSTDVLKKRDAALIERCLACYSPDDSATDWADKMRAMAGELAKGE